MISHGAWSHRSQLEYCPWPVTFPLMQHLLFFNSLNLLIKGRLIHDCGNTVNEFCSSLYCQHVCNPNISVKPAGTFHSLTQRLGFAGEARAIFYKQVSPFVHANTSRSGGVCVWLVVQTWRLALSPEHTTSYTLVNLAKPKNQPWDCPEDKRKVLE